MAGKHLCADQICMGRLFQHRPDLRAVHCWRFSHCLQWSGYIKHKKIQGFGHASILADPVVFFIGRIIYGIICKNNSAQTFNPGFAGCFINISFQDAHSLKCLSYTIINPTISKGCDRRQPVCKAYASDEQTFGNMSQMIKASVPYMCPQAAGPMAMLARFLELQNTVRYFKNPGKIQACGIGSRRPSPEESSRPSQIL